MLSFKCPAQVVLAGGGGAEGGGRGSGGVAGEVS